MAVTQNLFLGRMRGKVGALVFTQNKGRNIVKAAPTIVTNPRSGQQQANRSRFTALLALGRVLRVVLQIGYREYAGSLSWLNKFMSTNSSNGLMVWNAGTTTWDVDFSKLVISEGSLEPTILTLNELAGQTMTIDWYPANYVNQTSTDKIFVVAFVGAQTNSSLGTIERHVGTLDIVFDTAPTNGQLITVVGFFQSSNGEIVSNSSVFQFVVGS